MNQGVALSPAIRKAQVALTVVGLSGIVLSFVTFSSGITPLPDVLLDWDFFGPLWLLAAPCMILPVPISVGYVFWLINRRLPFWIWPASSVLSAWLVVSCLVALIGDGLDDPGSVLLVFLFGAAFLGGIWLSILGTPQDSSVRGLVLMQSVYIAPMTFFVVGVFVRDGIEYLEIGTLLGAVTLLTYLVQIVLAAKRFVWATAVVLPMTCIATLIAVDVISL